MTSAGIRLFESLGPGLLPTAEMAFYENNAKKCFKNFHCEFYVWRTIMSEMHVAHTNHLSRMQSLFESCRGSSVTKPFLVTVQSTICSAVLTHDIV